MEGIYNEIKLPCCYFAMHLLLISIIPESLYRAPTRGTIIHQQQQQLTSPISIHRVEGVEGSISWRIDGDERVYSSGDRSHTD